jgi:hypothetical protein
MISFVAFVNFVALKKLRVVVPALISRTFIDGELRTPNDAR